MKYLYVLFCLTLLFVTINGANWSYPSVNIEIVDAPLICINNGYGVSYRQIENKTTSCIISRNGKATTQCGITGLPHSTPLRSCKILHLKIMMSIVENKDIFSKSLSYALMNAMLNAQQSLDISIDIRRIVVELPGNVIGLNSNHVQQSLGQTLDDFVLKRPWWMITKEYDHNHHPHHRIETKMIRIAVLDRVPPSHETFFQ